MKLENLQKSVNKKVYLILPITLLALLLGIGVFFKATQVVASPQLELKPVPFKTSTKSLTRVATASPPVKLSESILGARAQTGEITTYRGSDLLVLVNKRISLPGDFVPDNLVSIENIILSYSGAMLRSEAANALNELYSASKAENLSLIIVSAYRSYAQQVSVFNGWVNSAGLKSAESFSAHPGKSQHQLGTAVDFGATGKNSLSPTFASTAEGIWLAQNAYKFGFILSYPSGKEAITGYSYEPWHFRYIGKENAKKVIDSGLILEEYLQKFGVW